MSDVNKDKGKVIIHTRINSKLKKIYQENDSCQISIPVGRNGISTSTDKETIQKSYLFVDNIYDMHRLPTEEPRLSPIRSIHSNEFLYKIEPFATFLESTKYQNSAKKRKRKRRFCGLPLWILCLLCYFLIALLAILAAVILSLSQLNKQKPLSTLTTITSITTTSCTSSTSTTATTTTTSSTSTTSETTTTSSTSTTSTATTTSSTSTTTVTTTTTTTTHKSCSSLTTLVGYDYYGYDIAQKRASNFTACCESCFATPLCVVFTLRTTGTCFLKNSTAGGAVVNSACNSTLI